MTKRPKREISGTVVIDDIAMRWEVRSEPQWKTTNGDIGMRLTIEAESPLMSKSPLVSKNKAHRELILEYPFQKRQKKPSRFPDRPKIHLVQLTADIRLAMEAGWEPLSRGRPFVFALFDEEDA